MSKDWSFGIKPASYTAVIGWEPCIAKLAQVLAYAASVDARYGLITRDNRLSIYEPTNYQL